MNETKGKKKSGRRRPWFFALLLLLLFGALAVGSGVAAKYLTARKQPQNIVDTQMFYFTSNYLTDEDPMPEIPVSAGTTSLTFDLYNYADELRNAELDIEYTLTLEKPEGSSAALSLVSGTLTKNTHDSQTITLSGLENGKEYVVKAVGTNGYSKTIRAKFVVAPDPAKVYKSLDTSHALYVLLTVWTEGEAKGAASITYPQGLIPDNTDRAMRTWPSSLLSQRTGTDSSSFTTEYSSHTYRFFTADPGSFSVSDFQVTVGGIAAVTP